jgi:hypothetical protein
MTDRQNIMCGVLESVSAASVIRAFTDYHGMQLLDEGFYEFLIDEGFIEAETFKCGNCSKGIDKDEWEENGSPECWDCRCSLCSSCLTACSDKNNRCPYCAEDFKKESEGNNEN